MATHLHDALDVLLRVLLRRLDEALANKESAPQRASAHDRYDKTRPAATRDVLDVVALAHHQLRVRIVERVELVLLHTHTQDRSSVSARSLGRDSHAHTGVSHLEALLRVADLVQRSVVATKLVDADLVFFADLEGVRTCSKSKRACSSVSVVTQFIERSVCSMTDVHPPRLPAAARACCSGWCLFVWVDTVCVCVSKYVMVEY